MHEIPVGPVHAGIIEPGHFRFQVVGEKVLRLEERLGYTHKGIEKRFESMPLADGHRLAGRISGDSTVAYAWAYAQAVEAIAGVAPPPRAAWLRALALERERIANHLGDLGYLGNDAGFAFGLAQFSRLKEDVLRANRRVRPSAADGRHRAGRRRARLSPEHAAAHARRVRTLAREIRDRARHLRRARRRAGSLPHLRPRHAGARAQLGLTGLAGRASGQACDLRCDFPAAPYDALAVHKVTPTDGDVAARVAVRFDEALESLRLIRAILDGAARRRDRGAAAGAPANTSRPRLRRRLARTGARRA